MAPERIEDVLVGAGLATAADLERARRRMSQQGGGLLANLVAIGAADDERLARALSARLGLPLVGPDEMVRVAAPRTPSRRAALRTLSIERVLLPIGARRQPREVDVAMFDPFDREAVARLQAICGGAAVRVLVAPRRALLDAIGRTYGREQSGVLGEAAASIEFTDIHDHIQAEAAALGAAPLEPPEARGSYDGEKHVSQDTTHDGADSSALTPVPEMMREARLYRVLLDATALLADLLEERTSPRPRAALELGRAVRAVAQALGLAPVLVDELGLAAELHAVERALADEARQHGTTPPSLADALGWAAGTPGGVGPMLRALAHAEAGRAGALPLGAELILAVEEYLRLAAAIPDGKPDPETVKQLLRVTTSPDIIEALLRALQAQGSKEKRHAG